MKKILALLTVAVLALTVFTACTNNKPETNQPADGQIVNAGNTVSNPAVATDENKTETAPPADKKPAEAKTEAPTKKADNNTEAPAAKPEKKTETQKKTEPAKKTEGKTKVTTTKAGTEVKITKEEAKKAVLKHAGLNENEISIYKIELDRERIGPVYEIELYTGKYEYEYEVNAETGKIIKGEKELRD